MCTSTYCTYACGCIASENSVHCADAGTAQCPGILMQQYTAFEESCKRCKSLGEEPVEVVTAIVSGGGGGGASGFEQVAVANESYASGILENHQLIMYETIDEWLLALAGKAAAIGERLEYTPKPVETRHQNLPPAPPPSADGDNDGD